VIHESKFIQHEYDYRLIICKHFHAHACIHDYMFFIKKYVWVEQRWRRKVRRWITKCEIIEWQSELEENQKILAAKQASSYNENLI